MKKYAYKNIIIDPMEEGIESLIGKEVYASNIPSFCLEYANDNDYEKLGVLIKLNMGDSHPFVVNQGSCSFAYTCIIPKEPRPKYMPFKSTKEFIKRYRVVMEGADLRSFDNSLFQRGMCLKRKNTETAVYCVVAGIYNNEIDICDIETTATGEFIFVNRVSLQELYLNYNFIDGSPCGKLVKE